jgi:hypothetical protein
MPRSNRMRSGAKDKSSSGAPIPPLISVLVVRSLNPHSAKRRYPLGLAARCVTSFSTITGQANHSILVAPGGGVICNKSSLIATTHADAGDRPSGRDRLARWAAATRSERCGRWPGHFDRARRWRSSGHGKAIVQHFRSNVHPLSVMRIVQTVTARPSCSA